MRSIAVVLPVLPGEVEQARQYGRDLAGMWLDQLADSDRKYGVTKEHWYLQETLQGAVLTLYGEAEDVERAFAAFAASDGPFERWQKEQLQAVTGVDFSQPTEGPLAEVLVEWHE